MSTVKFAVFTIALATSPVPSVSVTATLGEISYLVDESMLLIVSANSTLLTEPVTIYSDMIDELPFAGPSVM